MSNLSLEDEISFGEESDLIEMTETDDDLLDEINTDFFKHLTHDHFNMLIADINTLQTVYPLHRKENVIIGKLIPAGTGMKRYRNVRLDTDDKIMSNLSLEDEISFGEESDLESAYR